MEAIAKHDFNATAEDELSFRKNQVLKVSGRIFNMFTCRLCSIKLLLIISYSCLMLMAPLTSAVHTERKINY